MFVSDNTQCTVHTQPFFPMMMDLISLNTALQLEHIWFDDLTTHYNIHTHLNVSCTITHSLFPETDKCNHFHSKIVEINEFWSVELLQPVLKHWQSAPAAQVQICIGFRRPWTRCYSSTAAPQRNTSVRKSGFAFCPL